MEILINITCSNADISYAVSCTLKDFLERTLFPEEAEITCCSFASNETPDDEGIVEFIMNKEAFNVGEANQASDS
jgi:hypothetical protein